VSFLEGLSRTLKTLLQKGRPFILRRLTGDVPRPPISFVRFRAIISKYKLSFYGSIMVLIEADKTQRLKLLGEDTCALLCVIEASFGVKFTENEFVEAKTIGELAECIFSKLEHPLSEKCLSTVIFYRLRRTFIRLFDISRATITPETLLRELMPLKGRKRQWRQMQEHLKLVLPDLRGPLWLILLSLVIVISVFTLGWTRLVSFAGSAAGLLTVLGGFFAWAFLLKLLAPLARNFPRNCESFGDLVKLTLARNYGGIASEYGVSSEREVLLLLRQLIAAEESIDVQEILPDTLFPQGLKIY
jgi:hypothetical protein